MCLLKYLGIAIDSLSCDQTYDKSLIVKDFIHILNFKKLIESIYEWQSDGAGWNDPSSSHSRVKFSGSRRELELKYLHFYFYLFIFNNIYLLILKHGWIKKKNEIEIRVEVGLSDLPFLFH